MSEAGKLLGVDYGRARLGLAISDALRISIKPIGHINRESDAQAAAVLAALAQQEHATAIVIGLPLHAHGDAGENVEWVRSFCTALKQQTALPIHEVDERYTSSEAEAFLRDQGQWPAAPGVIDARAACIILQRFVQGDL